VGSVIEVSSRFAAVQIALEDFMFHLSAPRPFVTHLRRCLLALSVVAMLFVGAYAEDSGAIPRLVKFSGSVSGVTGSPSVVFALYKDATGGAPLWQEVQSVTLDSTGHYTALLGARSHSGIPLEVFSSNEARWLGVTVQGQPEQPRVLLVSVPYALKASDSETLGGLPPSAFLRADTLTTAQSGALVNGTAIKNAATAAVATAMNTSGATAGYLPVFTDTAGDLGNSLMAQSAAGVGIGTANPLTTLHLLGTNPTMRMENYGPAGSGDSPNFNFYTANGTSSAPTVTQNGDNLGQFAATGYNGTAFGGSKVKVTFVATENWNATSNGTAVAFHTTTNGTTSRQERVRIDNTGYVGIGTPTPAYPLDVSGVIRSTGGYMFPDGTTQGTAGIPVPSSCSANQQVRWSGTAWVCVTGNGAGSTVLGAGLTGGIASGVLTLNTDTTYLQRRVSSTCSSGSAIASVNQDGTVGCQTVSGGGAVSLPVNWTSAPNPPTTVAGVLNVTNTSTGAPEPTQSEPGPSFFATIPAAIVGTASGSQVTTGVAGTATGSEGIGVFAYTPSSTLASLLGWNGLTGYVPGSNSDWPKTIEAHLENAGGKVISAQADATTAPAACTGNNTPAGCGQTIGVHSEVDATSGQTVAFDGELYSPSAVGLNLNFNVPPTSGSMINANVNCGGTGSCPYFNVDGNGNINASGSLNVNGGINLGSGAFNLNNGLNVNGTSNFSGIVNANDGLFINGSGTVLSVTGSANIGSFLSVGQGFAIANGSPSVNVLSIDGGGNVNTMGGITAGGNINTNANMNLGGGLTTNGGGGINVNNGSLTVSGGGSFGTGMVINGNLSVSGTVSKSGGTFKIDHPLDPANKYLYHSFVESPDMMNIYNGVIVLDKHGKAVVSLPDYFEALNQDFRYQLTSIGAPGPNLYIASEISGNSFTIAGGKPGAKVSWQVTGIRHDAYAEAHRVKVEEDKGNERGTYLHPELFNTPQYNAETK
jgi:hypothetical protein